MNKTVFEVVRVVKTVSPLKQLKKLLKAATEEDKIYADRVLNSLLHELKDKK